MPPATDSARAAIGSVAMLAAQTLNRALAVAFALVATHSLRPDELGRYSSMAAAVFIAGAFADFGTTVVVARRVATNPDAADDAIGIAVTASVALGLLAAGVLVAATATSGAAGDIAIGAVALIATSPLTTLGGALDGVGRSASKAWLTAVQFGGSCIASVPLLLSGFGVRSTIVAFAVSPVVALLFAVPVVKRHTGWSGRLRFSAPSLAKLLREAVPYAGIGVVGVLGQRGDLLLLVALADRGVVAVYDVALRASEAAVLAASALTAPLTYLLTSRLAQSQHEAAQRAFDRILRLVAATALPLGLIAAGLAGFVTRVAFGADYGQLAGPLAILSAQLGLTVLAAAQGALVIAIGRIHRGLLVAATITTTRLLIAIPLITRWDAVGAAAASLVGQLTAVLAFGIFNWRAGGIASRLPRNTCGALVVAAAVGILASLMWTWSAGLTLAGLACFALATVTGGITRDDLRMWRRS